MEKKTKLITIEYEEYLDLIRIKNNSEIEIKTNLIRELHNLHRMIGNDEVQHYLRQIINKIECDIELLQKEGSNNDN